MIDSSEHKGQLKTVRQFCQDNDSFTEGGVRHLIYNKDRNGFAEAFIKLGRRVLIHEGIFFKILMEQR
jgi:hypothetical protein